MERWHLCGCRSAGQVAEDGSSERPIGSAFVVTKAGVRSAGSHRRAGNSFGGIETVLGAERGGFCAAIDSAGGAQSWAQAPELQLLMTRAVRNAKAPIFFFQAANDYDLSPSKTLSAAMKDASRTYELKIYPPYGSSPQEGHTFGYFGSVIWADDAFRFLNQHCAK
jgi:carboxymethylenebutenolidase